MVDAKSIYGTGSSSAHAYCNKMALYMHSIYKYTLKKWRLGEATIFFSTVVSCTAR